MTSIRKITPLLLALTATLALASSGCAERIEEGEQAGEWAADQGFPINSPDVVYPEGWTKLEIDANSAKNWIDSVGHYHTDKNVCQKPGNGVFDVPTWNALATLLNQLALANPAPSPRCWDSPNGSKFYNKGIAELLLVKPGATPNSPPVTSKRKIFEYKNAEICTTIADAAMAKQVMELVENVLILADKADAYECGR